MEDFSIEKIIESMSNESKNVREKAVAALSEFNDPQAITHIVEALGDKHGHVRLSARLALKKVSKPEHVDLLLPYLKSNNPEIAREICLIFLNFEDQRGIEPILGNFNPTLEEIENFLLLPPTFEELYAFVIWFKSRLKINNNETKKIFAIVDNYYDQQSYIEEEEYDEDEEDEWTEDTHPQRRCLYCNGVQYIGDPNHFEHDKDCPIKKLVGYIVDFK